MLTSMSLTLDLDFDSETLKKYLNMLTLIYQSRVKEEEEEDRKRKERMKKDRKEIVFKPTKNLKPTPSELPTIVEDEPKAEESESDDDDEISVEKGIQDIKGILGEAETKEERGSARAQRQEMVKKSTKDAKDGPPKVKCECGIFVVKKNLKRHMTSKSHINNLKK